MQDMSSSMFVNSSVALILPLDICSRQSLSASLKVEDRGQEMILPQTSSFRLADSHCLEHVTTCLPHRSSPSTKSVPNSHCLQAGRKMSVVKR